MKKDFNFFTGTMMLFTFIAGFVISDITKGKMPTAQELVNNNQAIWTVDRNGTKRFVLVPAKINNATIEIISTKAGKYVALYLNGDFKGITIQPIKNPDDDGYIGGLTQAFYVMGVNHTKIYYTEKDSFDAFMYSQKLGKP